LLCGWLAGLRLKEAFYLSWVPTEEAAYLDLDRDRIVIPAPVAKAAEDQEVPLDPQLRAELEALPGDRTGSVFYFPRYQTERSIRYRGMSARIIKLAAAAGVKLTMQTLRRGFGCYYASRVPAQVLQKLMRHGNIALTMKFYANVDAAAADAVR